jgi:DNA-binding response OmpR family regulator
MSTQVGAGSIFEVGVLAMSRILVIESEPVAALLREFLMMEGYDVTVVCEAGDAVSALRDVLPDAVIVDPYHLGAAQRDFVRRLRLAASFRPVPLLVLQPGGAYARTSRAVASVASAVLPQPLDLLFLAFTLRSLIAGQHDHPAQAVLQSAAAYPG